MLSESFFNILKIFSQTILSKEKKFKHILYFYFKKITDFLKMYFLIKCYYYVVFGSL